MQKSSGDATGTASGDIDRVGSSMAILKYSSILVIFAKGVNTNFLRTCP